MDTGGFSNLVSCLDMSVNLAQYRRAVGVFINRNLSFNYKLNFKGHRNKIAISYVVLNKLNFSISNIIEIFIILVRKKSLKYKNCNIGRHLFLYIFFNKYLKSVTLTVILRSHYGH